MILTMDSVNWLNDLLRGFFGAIDYLIYTIISWILEGIFNLSSIAANRSFVEILYRRIYVILAIFMVFKLTVSFIQYLVNPDSMADKEKGVGKLIARTITMLVMLIALPILFFEPMPGRSGNETILNVLQTGVIKTIPKLVLGIDSTNDPNNSSGINAAEYGKYMAVMMLRSFYYPSECNPDSPAYDASAQCDLIESDNITDMNSFYNSLTISGNKGVYAYQYMWPLTSIAGILLVVILLGLAIDIAIRIFKMVLLQMVAPVPIMSYIDPKSSKDGAFASWTKKFVSTYIEIFMKLAVIYMLLLLISKMFAAGDNNLFGDSINNIQGFMPKTFVRVFLVIGLFKFVKEAPKFIKDALGIKDTGGGGGFMGKAAAGLAGAATGFAAGVAGGGGLRGGLANAAGGFSAGAKNAGSGKPLDIYGKMRDEQAKALGKAPGGLMGKAKIAANKRALAKMGVSEGYIDQAKKDYIKAQENADKLAAEYQRTGVATFTDADGTVHNGADAVVAAKSAAETAQTKYNKMDKAYESAGAKKGFYDKHKRGIVDRAKGAGHAVAYAAVHPIANAKNIAIGAKDSAENIIRDTFSSRERRDASGQFQSGTERYSERQNDRVAQKYAYGDSGLDSEMHSGVAGVGHYGDFEVGGAHGPAGLQGTGRSDAKNSDSQ